MIIRMMGFFRGLFLISVYLGFSRSFEMYSSPADNEDFESSDVFGFMNKDKLMDLGDMFSQDLSYDLSYDF